jgi:hypothetical protein
LAEQNGLTHRIIRFTLPNDDRLDNNNAAVVIPPGLGHASRSNG